MQGLNSFTLSIWLKFDDVTQFGLKQIQEQKNIWAHSTSGDYFVWKRPQLVDLSKYVPGLMMSVERIDSY